MRDVKKALSRALSRAFKRDFSSSLRSVFKRDLIRASSRADKSEFRLGLSMRLRFILGVVLSVVMLLSIAGCTTLSTSMTSFPESSVKPEDSAADSEVDESEVDENVVDMRELVELAVKTTNESEKTQSFWFAGYIKNGFQNRTTTSMYEGVAMRPEQAYIVNGRIAAQPFRYYRWGDTRYINRSNVWYRTESSEQDTLPFDPFGGYTDWLPFLESAKALPDEAILNNLSHVIEVRINAKEWVEQSSAPLFQDIKQLLGEGEIDERLDDEQAIDDQFVDEQAAAFSHALENTIVKMTLWIGKEDHVIYQYSTWIVMPLPGAGYIDQETYFRFYHYNDPSIPNHIQTPDRLEHWVLEFEEQQREGKLKGELER